ncbi:MAG: hypothetical protein PHC97_00130 [Patescibacteria group bacterium]|nr:hypothetical protein [Patescibacteria group bacterium]
MKKILIISTLTLLVAIILSGCAPQTNQTNTNNSAVNKNAPTTNQEVNTNEPTQKTELNINKADLDKLKADINKMEFENINGFSQ